MNSELLESMPIVMACVIAAMRALKALRFAGRGWYAHVEPLLPFPLAGLASWAIGPDQPVAHHVVSAWIGAASAMSGHAIWTQTVRGKDGRIQQARLQRRESLAVAQRAAEVRPPPSAPTEPPAGGDR